MISRQATPTVVQHTAHCLGQAGGYLASYPASGTRLVATVSVCWCCNCSVGCGWEQLDVLPDRVWVFYWLLLCEPDDGITRVRDVRACVCVCVCVARGPTRTSIVYEISIFQKSRLDFWFHTWFQWFHDFTRYFWFHPWFQISSVISWFHSWFLCFCWRFLELYYFSQWFGASTGDFTWLARFQATVNDLWNAVNIPSRRTRRNAFTSSISGVFSVITVLGCYNSSRN